MANDAIALLIQQALGTNGLQHLASNPTIAHLIAQSQNQAPVATIEQPPAAKLDDHEIIVIQLLRAFVATDDGNPIVGLLTKFARFAQSEVDKAKVKQV